MVVLTLALTLATVLTGVGCAGRQLAVGVEEVRQQARTARDNGALRCAPRELALADTNVEFAETELREGDYFRAREHLHVAEDNAREALRLSPADRCSANADRDHDGIGDATDRCPTQPEDKDGFQDGDGCPEADNDGDGIADATDKCPLEPEDKDNFQDQDGCPDPDNDQDGVADATDKCPSEAEDKDGFEDEDGCPDKDNDKDTVADGDDRCPNEAGAAANGGCPKQYEHIVVTTEKIELKQKVFFATNKAVIMARSHGLLAEIVNVLQSRPTMRLRIEGHTDSRGSANHNMSLSQERANAVRGYVMAMGIAADRLEAQGFGSTQPIETNKTDAGRERNRRVEFVITQQ